ncbi:MAG TPA: glycine cleavage T C-terminal barrel domain-containing protein, partial [Opitutales bacterium]|nr:glycine cleavage T C-terminal barrel domain-containing protein [Opitutales bacterium]
QALLKEKQDGAQRKVAYFVIEDRRIARPGMEIVDSLDRRVGRVLSGAFSPVLGHSIGSALIEAQSLADASSLFVVVRETRLPLIIKKPPLHR